MCVLSTYPQVGNGNQPLTNPWFVPRKTQVMAPSRHRQTRTTACFILMQLITQNYTTLMITLRGELESFLCLKKSFISFFVCSGSCFSIFLYYGLLYIMYKLGLYTLIYKLGEDKVIYLRWGQIDKVEGGQGEV